jgi:hypothetical protein
LVQVELVFQQEQATKVAILLSHFQQVWLPKVVAAAGVVIQVAHQLLLQQAVQVVLVQHKQPFPPLQIMNLVRLVLQTKVLMAATDL